MLAFLALPASHLPEVLSQSVQKPEGLGSHIICTFNSHIFDSTYLHPPLIIYSPHYSFPTQTRPWFPLSQGKEKPSLNSRRRWISAFELPRAWVLATRDSPGQF